MLEVEPLVAVAVDGLRDRKWLKRQLSRRHAIQKHGCTIDCLCPLPPVNVETAVGVGAYHFDAQFFLGYVIEPITII